MLDGRAVIAQRSRAAYGRLVRRVDAVYRLAADALVLSPRQPLVGILLNALLVGAHQLELERRRTGVEDEDVHCVIQSTVTPRPGRAPALRPRCRRTPRCGPSSVLGGRRAFHTDEGASTARRARRRSAVPSRSSRGRRRDSRSRPDARLPSRRVEDCTLRGPAARTGWWGTRAPSRERSCA